MRLSVHFATRAEAESLHANATLRVAEIAGASDKEDLLRRIGIALEFPDYFGMNWDAFDECLRDISDATLIINDAAALWTSHPAEMITLVDIWAAAAASSEGDLDLVFVL